MNIPKVSVMIPTYNQADYLKQTIESAMEQDYQNLEIIIADDCSHDKTEEIVHNYISDPRIKYFRNSQNIGRANNYRKTLFDRVTGEWVINLDGDDYFVDKHFVSMAIEQIVKHKNVIIVAAKLMVLGPNYKRVYPRIEATKCINGFDIFLEWHKNPLTHLGSMYNKKIACDINFYQHNILSTDSESLLKILLCGNVVLLNIVAGVWRIHGQNASLIGNSNALIENLLFIQEPYKYALETGKEKNIIENWRKHMVKAYINSVWGLISREIFWGNRKEVFRCLWDGLIKENKYVLEVVFYPKNIMRVIYIVLWEYPLSIVKKIYCNIAGCY